MHYRTWVRWTTAVALASASFAPVVFAQQQESQKTLPSLLIKGEVVSVDTSDPTAALLKVKDRYGFETPIYLAKETKIVQGDQAMTIANLAAGKAVEVEYNFDINTAKRHAVNVALSAAPAALPAAMSTPETSPAASSPAAPDPTPVAAAPTPSPAPASEKTAAAPVQPTGTKTQ